MGFSDKQVRALSRSVPARNIRTRVSDGKELSYIEGWYALAEANRIFGFDGWDRETIETKCILSREARGTYSAVYFARVKISVRTSEGLVIRDGHGTGEAHGHSAGEVHDRALKAAETDATKRALATFGKAFGLALYAGLRRADLTARVQSSAQKTPTVQTPAPVSAPAPDQRAAPATVVETPAMPATDRLPAAAGTKPNATEPFHSTALPARIPAADLAPVQAQRIDKSVLTLSEVKRVRDKEHLRYVSSQPCLLCSTAPSDAHHLRYAQPRALGRKVSDEFTVPLCRPHHHQLHRSGNESNWWHDMGIEPLDIAKELWKETIGHRSGRLAKHAGSKPS